MKGWIALDIDGTITNDKYSVPSEVTQFLRDTHNNGWQILIATGRAFSFANLSLKDFDFPFTLSAQNGSIALAMPSQEILFKRYMKRFVLDSLEKAYAGEKSDFIIYSGYEEGDFCYFRPKRLSEENLAYVEAIQKREKTSWQAVDEFPQGIEIPMIKCFGRLDFVKKIAKELSKKDQFQLALIRDPFHTSYHLLMVADRQASKGKALKEMIFRKGRGNLVIAAGDDDNDISLLKNADVKIAMPQAPESVREMADFIAPPVDELGIIQALKIAIKNAID